MIFIEIPLHGAFIIEPEKLEDGRGFFARTWCQREFEEMGLTSTLVQSSVSYSKNKGTLRGMHYQRAPCEECKLVRCTAGAIYDVIIDLRSSSSTFTQHFGVVLSAKNYRMLYVPQGFAHGFQTLEDHSEVVYHMSEFYVPNSSMGVRWNDPSFGIQWPIEHKTISSRDKEYPDFIPSKILES